MRLLSPIVLLSIFLCSIPAADQKRRPNILLAVEGILFNRAYTPNAFETMEPHCAYENGGGIRLGKKISDINRVPAYWPGNETIRGDMLDRFYERNMSGKKLKVGWVNPSDFEKEPLD